MGAGSLFLEEKSAGWGSNWVHEIKHNGFRLMA
jgi:hypothetical protein